MIKRWFRRLKTKLIYVNEFHSPRELCQAIRQYISDYNTLLPHEALDYETPKEFGAALTSRRCRHPFVYCDANFECGFACISPSPMVIYPQEVRYLQFRPFVYGSDNQLICRLCGRPLGRANTWRRNVLRSTRPE